MSECSCGSCGATMTPRTAGLSRHAVHEGRGLCSPCYQRVERHGDLTDHPRRTWSRDDLMTEWDMLRSDGYTRRNAAERLGLKWETFDRAFFRAKAAGDPRAVPEQASDAWSVASSARPPDHTMGRVR